MTRDEAEIVVRTLRGVADALPMCDICDDGPIRNVVTMTTKPGVSKRHGPECDCEDKPLTAAMCQDCTDKAMRCGTAGCPDPDCPTASVTVTTYGDFINDHLEEGASAIGVTVLGLRFAMGHAFSPATGEAVMRTILEAGGQIDFSPLVPIVTLPKGAKPSRTVRRGKGQPPKQSRQGNRPITGFVVPFDGNLH